MIIDAWWFNNIQTEKDALYRLPDLIPMPKTHIGIYCEGEALEFPIHLNIAAKSEDTVFENILRTQNGVECNLRHMAI